MTRHRLEVADVFREHGSEFFQRFGSSLSLQQRRAFDAIVRCRTKVLGGHLERCDRCGHQRNAYNSCRNRHCPKCQGLEQAQWMEARGAELLPIPYFHVTFTLPKEIGPITLQNQRVVYGILFRAAAETLQELAADPKHLGAEIGILAVLHSWGQRLDFHPHLHCVVSGGGIAPDGSRWVPCKRSQTKGKEFFVPAKILSRVFRGKFIDFLKRAFRRSELRFHRRLAVLARPTAFEQWLNRSVKKDWVVDVQRPFGSAEVVLKYLARYTHRVAILNRRLIDMKDGKVRFHYKDYADSGRKKVLTLEASEFIRRFLLHVLPSGFMRIRHYGLLANRHRREKLHLCRHLLGVSAGGDGQEQESPDERLPEGEKSERRCPVCAKGCMVIVATFLVGEHQAFDRILSLSRSPPLRQTG